MEFDYISDQEVLQDSMFESFEAALKDPEDLEIMHDFKTRRNEYKSLRPYKSHGSAKQVFLELSKRNETLVQLVDEKFRWDFLLFGYTTEGYMVKPIVED